MIFSRPALVLSLAERIPTFSSPHTYCLPTRQDGHDGLFVILPTYTDQLAILLIAAMKAVCCWRAGVEGLLGEMGNGVMQNHSLPVPIYISVLFTRHQSPATPASTKQGPIGQEITKSCQYHHARIPASSIARGRRVLSPLLIWLDEVLPKFKKNIKRKPSTKSAMKGNLHL